MKLQCPEDSAPTPVPIIASTSRRTVSGNYCSAVSASHRYHHPPDLVLGRAMDASPHLYWPCVAWVFDEEHLRSMYPNSIYIYIYIYVYIYFGPRVPFWDYFKTKVYTISVPGPLGNQMNKAGMRGDAMCPTSSARLLQGV